MSGTIDTGGARLHVEQRGSGPPLLIVQGGVSEAGATDPFVEHLAGSYTVTTYDRRGVSRSPAASDQPGSMAEHAADAAALLRAVATGPAHVLGVSIGALIAAHLAVREPDLVATTALHEPPMPAVLRDPRREAELDEVQELARVDVLAAIRRMAGLTSGPEPDPEARAPEPAGDVVRNLHRFFAEDFPAVRADELTAADLAGCRAAAGIVPTAGAESRGGWEHRCAAQLARRLRRELVLLPGGHNGPADRPAGAARVVHRILGEGPRSAT